MLPNCPEVIQSYGGIWQAGGVIVPVIFLLGDEEVAHIVAHSEAKVVITSSDMLWKVEAQIGVLPSLHHVLLVDGGGDGRTRSLAAETAGEPDRFETVERSDARHRRHPLHVGNDGAAQGRRALPRQPRLQRAVRGRCSSSWTAQDWAVAVLPLSHSYGLTLMNAGHILGTRAALLRWFNPEEVLRTIQTLPGHRDVGRADHVRLSPELPRGRPLRHLVHARRGDRARRRCPSSSSSPSRRSSAAS